MIKVSQARPKDASTDRFKIEVTTILELYMADRIALMNNNREAERALRVYRVLWQWERLLASKRSQSLRAVSA